MIINSIFFREHLQKEKSDSTWKFMWIDKYCNKLVFLEYSRT